MINLLSWTGTLMQWNEHTELFSLLHFKQSEEYIHPIEAEVLAVERVTIIRQSHRVNGIEKTDQAYNYMKAALTAQIEQGVLMDDNHTFCEIILN